MEVEITILNWEKYQQGRKDVNNPTWFRVNVGMWRSAALFGLTAEEKWVWLCVLSYSSEKNIKTTVVPIEWFCRESSVDIKTLYSSLDKLARNGCVTWTSRERDGDVTATARARDATDRQTNKQTDTTTACFPSDATLPVAPQVLVNPFVDSLSRLTKERLENLYPGGEVFVKREVEKMRAWLEANPKKSPRSKSGWSRFILGWLERSWDRERKHIPTNKPKQQYEWDEERDE